MDDLAAGLYVASVDIEVCVTLAGHQAHCKPTLQAALTVGVNNVYK